MEKAPALNNKIYISGKISGIEYMAPELFKEAEDYLRKLGYDPINPMTLDHSHDLSWESYMRVDLKALCDCHFIYMLDNWSTSKGAKKEKKLASWLKIPRFYQGGKEPLPFKAQELINEVSESETEHDFPIILTQKNVTPNE